MPQPAPSTVRHIFLTPRPNFGIMVAAGLLGMSEKELRRDIADGVIVAVSTRLGVRIPKEEMIAAAMRLWEQAAIEEALGEDAASVLPEAIRLVLLRVRIPRWQREMLVALARKHGTTVDEVVTRELEDVACAVGDLPKIPPSDHLKIPPLEPTKKRGISCRTRSDRTS